MNSFYYKITIINPIVLSSIQGDQNSVTSLSEIPGSMILGALAGHYIKIHKIENNAHLHPTFYDLFLSGDVRFGNARLLKEDEKNNLYLSEMRPISFQNEKEEEAKIQEALLNENLLKWKEEYVSIHSETNHVRDSNLTVGTIKTVGIKKSINFHHKRDREKGSSEEGKIFNYESINSNQEFGGEISGLKAKALKEFIINNRIEIFYLGRSRNSQYGKVKFEIIEKKFANSANQKISLHDFKKNHVIFRLISDTVIYNEFGFPETNEKNLESYIKNFVNSSLSVTAILKSSEYKGFNSQWKLRKPSENCYSAGTSIMIEATEEFEKLSDDHKSNAIEKLNQLLVIGIGEKTNEGYGQVRLDLNFRKYDPEKDEDFFDYFLNREEFKIKQIRKKPSGEIFGIARNILESVFEKQIKSAIEKKAFDLIESATIKKNKVSPSLFGSLEQHLKNIEMIGKDSSEKEFSLIRDLKKKAQTNLEAIRVEEDNHRMALFDYLQKKQKEIDSFASSLLKAQGNENIKSLTEEFPFLLKRIDNNTLLNQYFQNLFYSVRKKLKAQAGTNHE